MGPGDLLGVGLPGGGEVTEFQSKGVSNSNPNG